MYDLLSWCIWVWSSAFLAGRFQSAAHRDGMGPSSVPQGSGNAELPVGRGSWPFAATEMQSVLLVTSQWFSCNGNSKNKQMKI